MITCYAITIHKIVRGTHGYTFKKIHFAASVFSFDLY